jgi:hypothetical protein
MKQSGPKLKQLQTAGRRKTGAWFFEWFFETARARCARVSLLLQVP